MTRDEILDLFFDIMKDTVESITLPTGDTLVPTFIYSVFLLVVSVVSSLVFPITCIDWRGAAVASILMLILAIVERRGVNEVSRLYRVVRTGASTLKERAKRSGAAVQAVRGTNPGDEMPEEVGGSADSTGPVQ